MIAETVVASVTAIILGSLWLADRVVKRTLKDEGESDEFRLDAPRPFPYERLTIKSCCPFCGDGGEDTRGPKMPHPCPDLEGCPVQDPHTHLQCQGCGARWAMKATVN